MRVCLNGKAFRALRNRAPSSASEADERTTRMMEAVTAIEGFIRVLVLLVR